MAKNQKNGRSFKEVTARVWYWVLDKIVEPTVSFIIKVVKAMLCIILEVVIAVCAFIGAIIAIILMVIAGLLSFIWVPFYLCTPQRRERLAEVFYRMSPTETNERNSLIGEVIWHALVGGFSNTIYCGILEALWYPVVNWLSIEKRKVFIITGRNKRKIASYPTSEQVALFRILDSEKQKDCIGELSSKARDVLFGWDKDEDESRTAYRKLHIEKIGLRADEIKKLFLSGDVKFIDYNFSKHTPGKEILIWLSECSKDELKENAHLLVKRAAIRKRPEAEILKAVYKTGDDAFSKEMQDIVSQWVEVDIVNATALKMVAAKDYRNEYLEEQAEADWTDFCKGVDEISTAAQMAIREWQYQIFVETGHRLTDEALESLVETVCSSDNLDYFQVLLDTELQRISESGKMMSTIKLKETTYSYFLKFKNKK